MAPPIPASGCDGEAAAEHGEQQEDHFAGVQVSVADAAPSETGRARCSMRFSSRLNGIIHLPKRMREQLPGEAAEAFDLEAVEHDDQRTP